MMSLYFVEGVNDFVVECDVLVDEGGCHRWLGILSRSLQSESAFFGWFGGWSGASDRGLDGHFGVVLGGSDDVRAEERAVAAAAAINSEWWD